MLHEMSSQRDALIILARCPTPGSCKTRLIPLLGPKGAAQLHSEMIRHTLNWAADLANAEPTHVELHYEGPSESAMRSHVHAGVLLKRQASGDLGQRMLTSARRAFQAGAKRVVLVGTDCPGLTADAVSEAFRRLYDFDVVLGPATDGGYYLIGMRALQETLFRDIAWGTGDVLKNTLQRTAEAALSVHLLEPLSDVDRPKDLGQWRAACRAAASTRIDVSVIIPTLNEETHIRETLASIDNNSGIETIVVDGGSTDGTPQILAEAGVRTLHGPRGRARQMNAGAAIAIGDILLFLHADSRLPSGFQQHIHSTLSRNGVHTGAFGLHIDGPGTSLRIIERCANVRARWLGLPYGDQGLFLNAETFHEIGGFPDIPFMEDVAMAKRLRRAGRIALAPSSITTSARRWRQLGPWRTTCINQLCVAGYALGISPETLRRFYHRTTTDH